MEPIKGTERKTMDAFIANLLLQGGANTAIVCIGAAFLGGGGGVVGVFALLRRRALMSDALSHATLPGVALAFLAGTFLFQDPKALWLLLLGAAISAGLGVAAVQWITENTRLPEDAAIGTVLSTFYGSGIVALSYVQTLASGGQAGLGTFLLGSAAGLLQGEALLIAGLALAITIVALLVFKEMALVSFDTGFAAATGISVRTMDLLIMGLLTAVIVVGLQTVGLVLVIALVIIPPAAARFWTHSLVAMVAVAAAFGAVGSYIGVALSASFAHLPTGGIIVLVLFSFFAVSILFAPRRGVIASVIQRLRLSRKVQRRQAVLALSAGQINASQKAALQRWHVLDKAGVLTTAGAEEFGATVLDEAMWAQLLIDYPDEARRLDGYGVDDISAALSGDLVAELKTRVQAGLTTNPNERPA